MPQQPISQNVSKLKELLFDRESRELDELRRRLEALDGQQAAQSVTERRERGDLGRRIEDLAERAGGDAQMQRSVARVIDGAIRDAEAERHNELTQAMAPMVRRTFRAELKTAETQDQLTSVFFPKIGEMIRRFIASSMRDMMDDINRRLESGLKGNKLVLKLRSIATGRSMAELALADTQRFMVEEIYLVRRGSGELIKHWSRTPDPAGAAHGQGSNRDTLISGFLTAITSFAEEAFAADKSSLRSLDLDDHRIYLRASPAHLLAAKCSGRAEAAVEGVLDAELLTLLEAHQKSERPAMAGGPQPSPADIDKAHEQILGEFSERIEQQIGDAETEIRKSRGGLGPLKTMLILFGLPIALYAGWQSWITYQTNRVQAAVDAAIGAMPELGGYPVSGRVERGGGTLWVSGLVPTVRSRAELLAKIQAAAPATNIAETIGVLPSTDVRPVVEAAARQRAMDGAQRRLAKLGPDLEQAAARFEAGAQRGAVEAALKASTETLGSLNAAAGDTDTARLNAKLHAAIERLRTATQQIAELTDRRGAALVPPAATLPRTPAESADELTAVAERLAVQVAALEQMRLVAPLERRNAELEASLAQQKAQLDAIVRQLQPTPREALAKFLRASAVFFSNATEFRDVQAVKATLDDVVRLALKTDLLVRVVGYTDEAGDPKRNQALSQQRADKVADELAGRGLPRNRIVAVGRGTAMDVAPKIGVTSANRRVEFEIGFPGEEGGP